MKRSWFTEEQITAILREQDAGVGTDEVYRRYGVSSVMFHKRNAKSGGLEVPKARHLKVLEDENGRLKQLMLADAMSELTDAGGAGGSAV